MNLGLNFTATTLTLALLGVLALIVMRWFTPELNLLLHMSQAPVDAQNDADQWDTPFYLRYNTPIPSYLANLMPVPSNYAYALGVPSAPYTQQTVVR